MDATPDPFDRLVGRIVSQWPEHQRFLRHTRPRPADLPLANELSQAVLRIVGADLDRAIAASFSHMSGARSAARSKRGT